MEYDSFRAFPEIISSRFAGCLTFQVIFLSLGIMSGRNFLLAKRIMRSFNCTPQSHPTLPDCSMHPLWQAWDAAVEHCLLFVSRATNPSESMNVTLGNPRSSQPSSAAAVPTIQSPFFNEQLMAFEIWLDFGGPGGSYKHSKEPPVYLPILLQVDLLDSKF